MNIIEKYNQQLKPCPFCGDKANIAEVSYGSGNYGSGHQVVVYCNSCNVEMKGKDTSWDSLENCEPQIRDIVERWNKRV